MKHIEKIELRQTSHQAKAGEMVGATEADIAPEGAKTR